MKKTKVVRIIARLNIGGPALHTVLLTAGLSPLEFESCLIAGSVGEGEGDMSYYAEAHGVHPCWIPELGRELSFTDDLAAFYKIFLCLRRLRPDILHTHTAKAGALGRLAGLLYNLVGAPRRQRVRIVHTYHGTVFKGYFGTIKTRIFIWVERLLGGYSDRILTVSDTVRKELVELRIADPRKIEVVPLGFDLDGFLCLPSAPLRRDVTVGIVGRLVPIKNHRLFLDAAARLVREYQGGTLRFCIVGDGQLREELQGYVRTLGLDSMVEFLGWQKDLPRVYSMLDLVALTSLNEGTPVSLIEAMASARPVAATDVGGVRDLLGEKGERGILVRGGDPEGFSNAMLPLLKDHALRTRLGNAGREFVRERFTKERLIRDIENVYKKLGTCP